MNVLMCVSMHVCVYEYVCAYVYLYTNPPSPPPAAAWYLLYGTGHSQLAGPAGVGGVPRGPAGETIRLEPLTPPALTPTPLQALPRPSPLPRSTQPYSRLTQVDTVLITR